MRRQAPMSGLWLIVITVIILVLANRIGRSFGPMGVLLPLIVTVLVFWVLRSLNARGPWAGVDRWRADERAGPKDVTPREPAIPPRVVARPRYPPPVIVVDPAEPHAEQLETKLQALDRLKASGLVTDEEYEAKRARLIADF